ncbi:MAG: OmpA family protein [Bacteroidota bacterium]
MKSYVLSLLGFSLLLGSPVFAQEEPPVLTSKDSTVVSAWVIGLGINIVDDSATPFGDDFLNVEDTWHAVPYPSRVSIGRFFKSGLGLEAIGTYNRYKPGKIVNGVVNTELREYFAIDGKISYDLNKLIGHTGWFDPYVHVGGGYTSIGGDGLATGNAGFGFNTWFSDRWGLNLNTMGKWGLEEDSSRHIQHSAAVVYRFGIEKDLTKKGRDKLALMEAMEKEKQRVNDSIAAANRIKEEAALAERLLAQEREQRLANAEKAKRDSLELRKRKRDELANLTKVYYAFNSSYLTATNKMHLGELIDYMNKYPESTILVKGHADSRGDAQYNEWLSKRRAKSVLKFVVSKGIPDNRIQADGYGESEVTNHCVDGVVCTSEEHKANRRIEYILLD